MSVQKERSHGTRVIREGLTAYPSETLQTLNCILSSSLSSSLPSPTVPPGPWGKRRMSCGWGPECSPPPWSESSPTSLLDWARTEDGWSPSLRKAVVKRAWAEQLKTSKAEDLFLSSPDILWNWLRSSCVTLGNGGMPSTGVRYRTQRGLFLG